MKVPQRLQKLYLKTGGFVKHNAPTILTCVGAAGVVATSVMTAKATIKAVDILKDVKEEKGEELTGKELLQTIAPVYISPVLMGLGTIACFFGANALNKRTQASLISAYGFLDQSFKDYKDKVKELHGEEAEKEVRHEIAKEHRPRRFR